MSLNILLESMTSLALVTPTVLGVSLLSNSQSQALSPSVALLNNNMVISLIFPSNGGNHVTRKTLRILSVNVCPDTQLGL